MIRKGLVIPLFGLLVLAGCQKGNPNAPASVSGQVMYKGEALTAGNVFFHTTDKGTYAAPIGPDGTFVAHDIPTGDLVVTIETETANPERLKQASQYKGGSGPGGGDQAKYKMGRPKQGGGGIANQPGGAGVKGKVGQTTSPIPEGANTGTGKYVKIPARYADPATSKLTQKVVAGKNDGLKFELTD